MENAQPEPSMEEILASIRRIISEDAEEPGPEKSGETAISPDLAVPEAKPTTAPDPEDRVEEPPIETEDFEMLKKNVAEATTEVVEDAILDQPAADAATQAFRSLSQTVRVADGESQTLEDIVVQMLNPMIKEWLNANLPAIVEEIVAEEVERVARRRRG